MNCLSYLSAVFCFLILLPNISAQKVLQLEKRNSAKTDKIPLGSQLIYQVKGDDIWYEATIEDIKPEDGYLVLHNRLLNVNDITAIKTYENRGWSSALSKKLYQFSASWILFGLADYFIFNLSPYRVTLPFLLIPAGVASGSAWLIKKVFDEKVYKIGRKFRLRLLDLTPVAAPAIP
ncbi:MAG: hypothetical protein AAGI23_13505 [Bacteroidota bacterium]